MAYDSESSPVSTIVDKDKWQTENWQLAADVSAGEVAKPEKKPKDYIFKEDKTKVSTDVSKEQAVTGASVLDAGASVLKSTLGPVDTFASTVGNQLWGGGWVGKSGYPKVMEGLFLQDISPEDSVAERDEPLNKIDVLNEALSTVRKPDHIKIGNYLHPLNAEEEKILEQVRFINMGLTPTNVNPDEVWEKFYDIFNFAYAQGELKHDPLPLAYQSGVTGDFNEKRWNKKHWQGWFFGLGDKGLTPDYVIFREQAEQVDFLKGIGIENLEVHKIFRDSWTSGDDLLQGVFRELSYIPEGLYDLTTLGALYGTGWANAKIKSAYYDKNSNGFDISFDPTVYQNEMNKVHANMANNIQRAKKWLDHVPFLDTQAERMNDFIRDKYLETHTAEEYEKNRNDLLLKPEQVAAIYRKSFNDSNYWTRLGIFMGGNWLSTWLAGKTISSMSRDNLLNWVKVKTWKDTHKHVQMVGGKQVITTPYRLSGMLTLTDEYIKATKSAVHIQDLKKKILVGGTNPVLSKSLPNVTFSGLRLQGKLESAATRIKLMEKEMDAGILDKYNKAVQNYNKAHIQYLQKGSAANSTILRKAIDNLDKAESNYAKELLSKVTKGKTYIPYKQWKKLFNDELMPTFFQNHMYSQWQGSGYEDSASALAYLGVALARSPVHWAGQKAKGTIYGIPKIGKGIQNVVFDATKMLDAVITFKKFGLSLNMITSPLLKQDIMNLKMVDPTTKQVIPITAQEYDRLLWLQKTLKSQDPDIAAEMLKHAKVANKNQEAMLKIFDKYDLDKSVKEQIVNSLTLSFGQQSGLDVLAGYQHKLLHNIRPNDVTKLTGDKFINYSKMLLDQKAMMQAQENTLNIIERAIKGLQPNLSKADFDEVQGIYLQAKAANTIQQSTLKRQIIEAETHAKILKEWVKDPRNIIGKSEEELELAIRSIVDTETAILNPKTLHDRMKIVNNSFADMMQAYNKSMEEYTNVWVEGQGAKEYNAYVEPTIGSIKTAGVTLFKLQEKYKDEALNAIYSPIKNLKGADGQSIKIKLVSGGGFEASDNLMGQILGVFEAEEFTNLHEAFKIGSPLHNSLEGKQIIAAVDNASNDAIVKHYMRKIDDILIDDADIKVNRELFPQLFDSITGDPRTDLTIDAKRALATNMFADAKKELGDAVRKKFKLSDTTKNAEINDSVWYKYIVENTGAKLDDIEVEYYDLEMLRRYVSRKADKYSQTKDTSPLSALNAKKYRSLADGLETMLERIGKEIKTKKVKLDTKGLPVKRIDKSGRDKSLLAQVTTGTDAGSQAYLPEYVEVETNAYDMLQFARFNAQSIVYHKYDEHQLLNQMAKMVGKNPNRADRVYKGVTLHPNVLNTAFGKKLVMQIFQDAENAEDLGKELHELLRVAYGQRRFKAGYEDWDTQPLTKERIQDLNDNGIEYVLNLDTDDGKLAMGMMQAVALQVIRELQVFQGVLRNTKKSKGMVYEKGFGWKRKIDDNNLDQSFVSKTEQAGKGIPTEQERSGASTFLSTLEGNGGIDQMKIIQEALMVEVIIKGEKRKIPLINLDQVIRAEKKFEEAVQLDTNLADTYNKVAAKVNIQIDKNLALYKVDLEDSVNTKVTLMDTMGVSNGQQMYQKIQELAGDTEEVITASAQQTINFDPKVTKARTRLEEANKTGNREQIKIAQKELNKITMETTEKVHRAYRTLLFDAITYAGKNDKGATTVKTMDGIMVTISQLTDPKAAFAFADSNTVRNLFEQFGLSTKRNFRTDIEPTEYDAFMGILGHLVMVKEWEEAGSLIPGTIPHQGYSDTGLISRAFNYARGMVGGPYLAVEAGFKIMKDNDLSVLNWMLSDKEAAKFIHKALMSPDPISHSEINTFVERMAAWVAKELANSGRTAALHDKEELARQMLEAGEAVPNLDGLDIIDDKSLVHTGDRALTAAGIAAAFGIAGTFELGTNLYNNSIGYMLSDHSGERSGGNIENIQQ